MNFTFVRAERSQEENQERAFIAASRRQDRDFKQRLESLQKASELHFARTGKRFEVNQAQVEHNGPLMELGDDEKRRREARQYVPYTQGRRRGIKSDNRDDFTMILPIVEPELAEPASQGLSQNEIRYQRTVGQFVNRERDIFDPQEQSVALGGADSTEIEGSLEEIPEEGVDEGMEDHSTSFFEMENWQNYHELEDVQKFLDVHFPKNRVTTPDEVQDLRHLETQTTESECIWKEDVHYEHVEDINEDQSKEDK